MRVFRWGARSTRMLAHRKRDLLPFPRNLFELNLIMQAKVWAVLTTLRAALQPSLLKPTKATGP